MPGFIAHVGATVTCAHQGQAMATTPNPKVSVSGQPIVTITSPYTVAGCAMPPPPAGNGPCVTGQFVVGSIKVLATGMPIVLVSSTGTCLPTGTPLLVMVTQTKVIAT